jgi:hypothetical protein
VGLTVCSGWVGQKEDSIVGKWKFDFSPRSGGRKLDPDIPVLFSKVRVSIFSDGTWERKAIQTVTWGTWKRSGDKVALTVTGTSPEPLDYKQVVSYQIKHRGTMLLPPVLDHVLVKVSKTPVRFRQAN